MTDQWQMARKWRAVKGQLDAATNGGKDVRYVKGTNIMTMNEIYARPWRARYGIVYADFPGRGLIHAVYNSNNFHGVFKGKESAAASTRRARPMARRSGSATAPVTRARRGWLPRTTSSSC
jgi:hypothetical protein